MLFNSYEFIFLFLPATLVVVYLLTVSLHIRLAVWWIGLASLLFYGLGEIRFLPILVGSILFNYAAGHVIISSKNDRQRRLFTAIGVIANLALLAGFKFTGFALESVSVATDIAVPIPAIALPIGISFYTFTQIAYIVDCGRGQKENYRFADYLLFVSFFPHLVAGPILLHKSIIPQLKRHRFGRPGARRLMLAWTFFSIGLFKKVLVADSLSPYVGELFANAQSLTFIEAWAAAFLYGFQLYYDFSGYSEMAFGLAFLLGVRIPINFNAPYKARSIIDFWRRWHISLSNFLRDYLYIPLGGNRKGIPRRYANLLITMILGGLWHGAGINFIIWGALHGLYLVINHFWRWLRLPMPAMLGWAVTFLAVALAWVPFRAATLADAQAIYAGMLGLNGITVPASLGFVAEIFTGVTVLAELPHLAQSGTILVALTGLVAWNVLAPTTREFAFGRTFLGLRAAVAALLFVASVFALGRVSEFLYFAF